MKIKIFYKFFFIILSAFLLVQYINLKIDYQKTLSYRVDGFKAIQERELNEALMSYVNDHQLSVEELINVFDSRFDHPSYCVHFLVEDTPTNVVEINKEEKVTWLLEERKAKKILGKYDQDNIITSHHGVKYIEPYMTYLNSDTGVLETEHFDETIDDYHILYQLFNQQHKDDVIYKAESPSFSYEYKGDLEDVILVDHSKYQAICKDLIHQYQSYKDYQEIQYFYEEYNDGIIFFTKTYISTSTDDGLVRIDNSDLNLSSISTCLNNEHMRSLKGYTDYYVYGFYYMEGLSLLKEIDHEINNRHTVVYLSVFIICIVVSLFLSWMLTRHIKEISKTTTKIANNDFSGRLKAYSSDELGMLSKNINLMSDKINATLTNLNEEIEHVKALENGRKEFIANFTHEIKTPLSIIKGYIELISQSEDMAKKEIYLASIQKEADKINEQVMSMLELSRLEAKKVELTIEEVDLEDLVNELLESYFPLLKQKQIKVILDLSDANLLADKNEIEKVIRNFLSNAIVHTRESGKIIISYQNHCFSIENEGDSLSEAILPYVFETYVSSNREGTGLGLAICKAILELHQFKYGVKNTEIGVCFYFEVLKE